MTDQRERIRAALEKHSPGTLAFMDSIKARFPDARLIQLDVPAAGLSLGQDPTVMPRELTRLEKLHQRKRGNQR